MLPNQKLTETLAEQNQTAENSPSVKKIFNFSTNKKSKGASAFDSFAIIKYIYPLTILIIISVLIWVFSFLYNNVYLTMAQAEVVSNLKVKVISEQLNKEKFNEILKNISDKNLLANWNKANIIKDPFSFGERNNYLNNSTGTQFISTSTSSTIPVINSSTSVNTSTIKAPTTATRPTSTKSTTTLNVKK